MESMSLVTAFIAGVISFISPCVLPLIPGYISFVSGFSIEDLEKKERTSKEIMSTNLNVLLFVLGFSTVFIGLGASATLIGGFLQQYQSIFRKIAGVIIIILGLHFMGVIRIPFLYREKRVHLKSKPLGLVGSFIIGMAFAFGWTPCIGPILGSILLQASTQSTMGQGTLLLGSYALGLGIPFLLTGIAINSFYSVFNFIKKGFRTIEIVAGVLLILIGILIFTNNLTMIASYLPLWGVK